MALTQSRMLAVLQESRKVLSARQALRRDVLRMATCIRRGDQGFGTVWEILAQLDGFLLAHQEEIATPALNVEEAHFAKTAKHNERQRLYMAAQRAKAIDQRLSGVAPTNAPSYHPTEAGVVRAATMGHGLGLQLSNAAPEIQATAAAMAQESQEAAEMAAYKEFLAKHAPTRLAEAQTAGVEVQQPAEATTSYKVNGQKVEVQIEPDGEPLDLANPRSLLA